jgi:hypothetical protein
MTIKKISILNDFKCSAEKCPANCCRGWKIPIDEETYTKYLKQSGLFGAVLRCSIEKKDEMIAFKSGLKGCPFWGLDRLCGIQKKHGVEYMPLVCIQFPRQLYNLGFFCEEMLYLACPEVARLFLMHINDDMPIDFVMSEGEPDYDVNTTNDDGDFLDYLLNSRSELINLLENGCSYNNNAITDYAISAQNAFLEGKTPPSPNEFWDNNVSLPCKTFTCNNMNSLMFNGFYHSSLKTISPFLYKLCRKYIHELGTLSKLNPSAADKKLNQLMQDLYGKVDNLQNLTRRYYEYFLLSDFLDIFEDYSFNKHISIGISKVNMLLVFLAVYSKNKAKLRNDEIAKIIAVFERRAVKLY